MNKKHIKGFTLVEILVSVAIIVVLSTMFWLNYDQNQRKNTLNLAVRQIVNDIRYIQNMALYPLEYEGDVYCGYGINFNSSNNEEYLIFGHNCNEEGLPYYAIGDQLIAARKLPQGVSFSQISTRTWQDTTNFCDSSASFIFMPPEGTVYSECNGVRKEMYLLPPPVGNIFKATLGIELPDGSQKEIDIFHNGRLEFNL